MNAAVVQMAHGNGNSDRIGVALLFSVMLHAILVLGLGFHFAKPAPALPTLDVTLVNAANDETPNKADFLAQANNAGGGNSDEAHRPGAPFSGPLPVTQPGVAPVALMPAAPAQQTESGPHILTTTGASDASAPQQKDTRATPAPTDRVAAVPVQQRLEMAQLAQEVRAEKEAYAKRPRKKYISANTRSAADAAYQVAWVHRIERVGNLNYPDAARTRHLRGDVVLTVTLSADGHVRSVAINQSSGYRVLDDATTRIVHLAAPFPPIPPEKDANGNPITELVLTRTWQFLPGDRLETHALDSH